MIWWSIFGFLFESWYVGMFVVYVVCCYVGGVFESVCMDLLYGYGIVCVMMICVCVGISCKVVLFVLVYSFLWLFGL